MQYMNKVALVTGASRGIGKAIAVKLAKEGYHVVINYNGSKEKALQVQKECKQYQVEAICIQSDVSDYAQVVSMVEEVINRFGRIDVLVNNSGITKDQILLRLEEKDFDDVINVNLKGTFNTIKSVTKIMMKQKSGSIINMSSVIGVIGNAGQVNYAASKAGVIGITKSVARELVSRNIRCNAVAPGFIDTEMTKNISEKMIEEILKNVPMKTMGSVEDVANVVAFLASDDSKYITGQVIHVDGGMVM